MKIEIMKIEIMKIEIMEIRTNEINSSKNKKIGRQFDETDRLVKPRRGQMNS